MEESVLGHKKAEFPSLLLGDRVDILTITTPIHAVLSGLHISSLANVNGHGSKPLILKQHPIDLLKVVEKKNENVHPNGSSMVI